jgi:hypothetical protein
MAGGNWTPGVDPGRPGLFLNFVDAAAAAVASGSLGTVAMTHTKAITGTAVSGKFYTVDGEAQAIELFGAANIASIMYVLKGGAKEVLVYVLSEAADESAYTAAFSKLNTRKFDAFVFDTMVSADIQAAALLWMQDSRDAGQYFHVVFGCTSASDDQTPENGIARCAALKDDFAVNLVVGVVDGVTILNSAQIAPYFAGLIASTPLNASTTYAVTPFQDVNMRLTNTQIKAALAAGAFVLVNDGEKVKVERGLCTSGKKIRRTRTQMAIVTDVTRTAENAFVGKVINNADGQVALISAIKTYMERMAANGVIDGSSIVVKLSDTYPSVGDQVFIDMSFRDLDSVEEIYLTVQIG